MQQRFTATAQLAARCRASRRLMATAWLFGALVMLVGFFDAVSTNLGLATGLVEEANVVMAWLQQSVGEYWLLPKMLMHAAVAAMILWYPHRLVLASVTPVIGINTFVIYNNLALSGLI